MKKLLKNHLAVGCAVLLALFAGANSAQAQVTKVPLVWNQFTTIGYVEALVLDGNLWMNITTTNVNFTMDSASVAVGETLADIPRNKNGSPKQGNFPYQYQGGSGIRTFFMVIPLSSDRCDRSFVLAVHAMAKDITGVANGGVATTAWAGGDQGTRFSEGNWATYFKIKCLFSDSDRTGSD